MQHLDIQRVYRILMYETRNRQTEFIIFIKYNNNNNNNWKYFTKLRSSFNGSKMFGDPS
jgi:hypothetical protein